MPFGLLSGIDSISIGRGTTSNILASCAMLATKCVGFVVSFKELVGKRLREIREDKGLSQEQLALDAGFYSGKTIRRFESGENALKFETIEALARALHCHPRDFFDFPWPPNDQS